MPGVAAPQRGARAWRAAPARGPAAQRLDEGEAAIAEEGEGEGEEEPDWLHDAKDVAEASFHDEAVHAVGSAALAVANEAWAIGLDALVIDDSRAPDVTWVARLGLIADPEQAPPRPLYLKAPETTPQDRARLPRR